MYHDKMRIEEFLSLMRKEEFVFLLMPSEDYQESLEILNSRIHNNGEKELNFLFINSETNQKVAKFRIYTKGKKPAETVKEIISIYNLAK